MAAPLDGGNQQHAAVNGGEDFPEDQQPPVAGARPRRRRDVSPFDMLMRLYVATTHQPASAGERSGAPERSAETTEDRRPERTVSRRSAPSASGVAVRGLRVCRRVVTKLVQWFAARPLGQKALQAVGCTIATAERATIWAGTATHQTTDRRPVPLSWYLMIPVVAAMVTVRTGADVLERCLNVQLPRNSDLVNFIERQRIHLEQLQTAAAANIRTQYVDENDPTHRFLNRWPLSVLYRAAQQLGIIAVRVHKRPSTSGSESTSEESATVPPVAPVSSSTSSTSTLTDAEEHAAQSSRELTPTPEAAPDRTSSLDSEIETEETKEGSEEGAAQDNNPEDVEGEKAQRKAEQPPTITEEEAIRAAMAVVSPQPSAPPEHLVLKDDEGAAMGEVPPPPLQPTTGDLQAAERASASQPGTSSRGRKATYKAPMTSFLNYIATKIIHNAPVYRYTKAEKPEVNLFE